MFYFDQWMWGSGRSRGETIGVISSRNGDVRLKYQDDLRWSQATNGQDLAYNDAVYAGAGSQAELQISNSKMTVTENTLVVLRRDQDVSFLNLNYGTLFGKLAKNDKFVIDTGNGKPIALHAGAGAQIVVRRTDGKTQLDLTAGEAYVTVDGQRKKVDKSSRLVFGDKTPALLQTQGLRILKPLRDQVIASEDAARIDFAWAWENARPASAGETYKLEFSADASFNKIHISKTVQGALTTSMTVSRSVSLFYRVKGPNDQVSAIEQVNFLRLEKPMIVTPQADAHFELSANSLSKVPFEFRRPEKATVWYQIATDAEFKDVVFNQNTPDLKQIQELPVGSYQLRARSDFGNGKLTAWTEARPFFVDKQLEVFRLSGGHVPTRVLIPNRAYPSYLYKADEEQVKTYLADQGVLKKFFPYKEGEIDELKIQMETGEQRLYAQTDSRWPAEHLEPGRFSYKTQVSKRGFRPSEWSSSKRLQIAMEPVKPMGDALYSDPDEKGLRQAQWGFTPLLYAASYDVEVSPSQAFLDPLTIKTRTPRVTTELPQGGFYWRARARDRQGRIISGFSQAYRLKDQVVKVPQFLAKNQEERKPAATERTATRAQRVREKPWERSGWWTWLGAGTNYVDYRQSIPTRGTLQAHHVKGPSQYFEGGYTGGNGVGGVLSYKNTPGEFTIPGVPILPNTFRWTSMSLEGIVRKTSRFSLFDAPIVYGMRAGVQQHNIPFLFLPALADVLLLRNNQMNTASFGLLAEMTRARWSYQWLMRYQFPLSSKADGASSFSMQPVFAFDGSMGASYNITQRMKLGLFWYGQWHQFNFVYGDTDVTNTGFQSLFYSNVDVRLGVDF
ncbi:MAG: hypothetical protein KF799_11350 [Bdellovibrionales bacterium]|nr:hypothetical protein [Bdellovibrionales bacterium]